MPRDDARTPRGFTILEAMIALAILLVGLLGTLQYLIYGAHSDRAAKAQTVAAKAAAELLTGLTQLPPSDGHLNRNALGATQPDPFGSLLLADGTIPATGRTCWSDASPIPGVRTDAQLSAGPEASLNLLRCWVIWDYQPIGAPAGIVRLVSVSVTYTDVYRREVVLYGQVTDAGQLLVRGILAG